MSLKYSIKKIKDFIAFWLLFLAINLNSQSLPAIHDELGAQISQTNTFHELRSVVISYYDNKMLNTNDEAQKSKYQRKLKHWNRYFWWNEHFIGPDGKIENYNTKVLDAFEIQKREQKSNQRHQSNPWTLEGPKYNTTTSDGIGRFDVMAFHPTNPNIIFAGACNGGLFKSTNGGTSWTSLSGYLPSLGVAGIVVHPTNANIIYVLSGSRNGGGFVSQYKYTALALGVFKTTDGGDTWSNIHSITNQAARDLIMDPNDTGTLLLSTSEGIFKTTNSGSSWSQIGGASVSNKNIWEIKFKPGSSDTIYAVSNSKVYRSINAGVLFTERYDIPTSDRISIAVTPDNPNVVMLLAGQVGDPDDNMVGVFKSTNGGGSFSMVYNGGNGDLFYNYIGVNSTTGQVTYNNTIEISPTNENIVLVGGVCIWKSSNGGTSWTQKTAYWPSSGLYVHPDQHQIKYNYDGKVYVANDGGVYVSGNHGETWTFIENGLSATQFYHFEVENDEGDIWGGTQDNGILEQDDASGGFYMYAGGDGYDVMTDHPWQVGDGEGDDIYFTVNKSIYKDCSGTICDISVPGNTNYFGNLAMSPDLEDEIYVGYLSGLWRSEDAGDSWFISSQISASYAVATCQSNSDRIYFAGTNGGTSNLVLVRYSISNNSETLLNGTLVDSGFVSTNKLTDIVVSPTNSNNVYVSSSGFYAGSKVFFSSNGGDTWNNISYNLPNVPVFSQVRDNTGGIYAGTYLGVYYKRSGVNHWEPFYNGLPPVPVTEMELYNMVNGVHLNIMISTFGRGIWKTSAYATTCPNIVTLTGEVNGLFYKDASNLINSTQIINPSEGTVVKYNAENEVKLLPGFHAKGPGQFKTYLLGCGTEIEND